MSRENDDQKAFWEAFATLWVTKQDELDRLMAPVLEGVLASAALAQGQRVLDIGCGTGTSTLQAAALVGAHGAVVGADISDPMLERARAQPTSHRNVDFRTADVADYPFQPASFDRVISRFGVMFFADPVAAFANIAQAMKPGARLSMACWSYLDRNPWFQVPMYAAKARLGAPPPVDPDAPGPLAFRDTARVLTILERAGFHEVAAAPVELMLTPPGDLRQVATHAASIGPAARAIEYFEATEADFAEIVEGVMKGFADYKSPQGVLVPAEINFYTAVA